MPGSFEPFDSRVAFDFACFHFLELKSSEAQTNRALDIWAASVLEHGGDIPWKNAEELRATIDEIQHGECPWKTYTIHYEGPLPAVPPKWMTETFELCCRDSRKLLHQQLHTPDFGGTHFQRSPYMAFNAAGERVWSNFMSGDWAHAQAVSDRILRSNLYLICHHLRTQLRKNTQRRLGEQCSWELFLEVTRRQYLLGLDINAFTLCISHPRASPILHVERTGMECFP